MIEPYNFKNIRTLLTEGFSEDELRRFCFDEPGFKPIYHQIAQSAGKAEIIDQLLAHAEKTLQLDTLLAWAESQNPARYAQHQPYFDLLEMGQASKKRAKAKSPAEKAEPARPGQKTDQLRRKGEKADSARVHQQANGEKVIQIVKIEGDTTFNL
jgi:hypothetical protein